VASTLLLVAPTAASATSPGTPFVAVHARLDRDGGGVIVTGKVDWDSAAASRAPDYMTEGDLRLVAVSDHGHRPKLLGSTTYKEIAADPGEDVEFHLKADDEAAIAAGNRVVLTASQHGAVSQGTRTGRTYVTVDQLQPFGSKQDRIGRRDCADLAIVQGAKLNECDLVGADLERAQVSVREPDATRMLLADLTGANLRGADLSGLSVAGGRLNGADAANAVLDNLSLAGVEATGLDAQGATSDRAKGTAGANIFDARLTDANFQGALLNGVSLDHSDLDGADFRDATWNAVEAETASFRGADLSGLKGVGSSVYFADLTDAKLQGAPFTPPDLAWATLCHTQMPEAGSKALEDRDCRAKVEPERKPLPGGKVAIDASLQRSPGKATIKATVGWNTAAITIGKSAGDLRLVAIDGSTGLPTTLATKSIAQGLTGTTEFEATITDPDQLSVLGRGNRIVLTATQHPPLPTARGALTNGSYVTVDTLQAGPGRGRVGSRDCSDLLIGPTAPGPDGYDFCDLAGAVLTRASLSGPMQEVDLSGVVLGDAKLNGIVFDGAALSGAVMTGAEMASVSMVAASAPRLTLPKTLLRSPKLRAADLDGADFAGDTISDGTFAASSLRRAKFSDATFDKVDLGYARLAGADLARVEALSPDPRRPRRSSLFLADLTGATLAGSEWADDEAGERPWQWATLCDTRLPADATVSGDRDCPRSYRG
jgi:uncharacterized protein YjbI with pentapeptide repeats